MVYHPVEGGEPVTIDFTPPFKRIDMLAELTSCLKAKLPDADTLHTVEANKFFDRLCLARSECILTACVNS